MSVGSPIPGCLPRIVDEKLQPVAAFERGSSSAQSPCPVGAAAEIHYGPGEDLERIDVALIREAAKQIDMAAYVLTDSAVIETLRAASARGEGANLARRERSGEIK